MSSAGVLGEKETRGGQREPTTRSDRDKTRSGNGCIIKDLLNNPDVSRIFFKEI